MNHEFTKVLLIASVFKPYRCLYNYCSPTIAENRFPASDEEHATAPLLSSHDRATVGTF
jgi:hypothetical protein